MNLSQINEELKHKLELTNDIEDFLLALQSKKDFNLC